MINSKETDRIHSRRQDERTIVDNWQTWLIRVTVREFHGLLTKKDIEDADRLREQEKNLITRLAIKTFRPQDCLAMGIVDLVGEDLLKKWASGEALPENAGDILKQYAKFFLEKKRTSGVENLPTSGAHDH